MSNEELYDFWQACQKIDKRVSLLEAARLARRLIAKKRAAKRRGPAQ
jgi:hypothetical protein